MWGVKKIPALGFGWVGIFMLGCCLFKYRIRRRPIFPGGYPPSIVGDESLYDRVRDGNGWCPFSLSPKNFFSALEVLFFKSVFRLLEVAQWCMITDFVVVLFGGSNYRLSKLKFARRSSIVSQIVLLIASRFATHRLPLSGKALVRLVMLGCVCCQISTCILSTLCSATGLTSLGCERSHLTVGFALICFQRLSAWNTATGRLPLAG